MERAFSAAGASLRWVHVGLAGVEHLLFPRLVESSVTLTNARGAFSSSLGEWAVFACLFFAKRYAAVRAAHVERRWDRLVVGEIRGATLGVIGYGDIGRDAARKAAALGMRVLAVRRRAQSSAGGDGLAEAVHPIGDLLAVLSQCDYVLLALPLTESTKGLFGAPELAAMKPSAVLINVGRGGVLDEAALTDALAGERLAGAALDVFQTEPLPTDSPLWSMQDKVLLSAHCADLTPAYLEDSMSVFTRNHARFIEGKGFDAG